MAPGNGATFLWRHAFDRRRPKVRRSRQGEDDRKERERRGWDALLDAAYWRYGTGSTDDERAVRWRVDEAMALLGEMATATAADVGYLQRRTVARSGGETSPT